MFLIPGKPIPPRWIFRRGSRSGPAGKVGISPVKEIICAARKVHKEFPKKIVFSSACNCACIRYHKSNNN